MNYFIAHKTAAWSRALCVVAALVPSLSKAQPPGGGTMIKSEPTACPIISPVTVYYGAEEYADVTFNRITYNPAAGTGHYEAPGSVVSTDGNTEWINPTLDAICTIEYWLQANKSTVVVFHFAPTYSGETQDLDPSGGGCGTELQNPGDGCTNPPGGNGGGGGGDGGGGGSCVWEFLTLQVPGGYWSGYGYACD